MKITILTLYILVWPVLSAAVLAALTVGVWRDMRQAKQLGEHLV